MGDMSGESSEPESMKKGFVEGWEISLVRMSARELGESIVVRLGCVSFTSIMAWSMLVVGP